MRYSESSKSSGSVSSSEGLPIYYDLYEPEKEESEEEDDKAIPVIIFLHGFKGFKDWGAFPKACQQVSKAGFAVLAINLSLNGVGESMTEFDQLDLFARETLSQDLNDVGSVVESLKDGSLVARSNTLETSNLGIIGHSRGGHTAVAAAAEYREIQCLVTWSAVADYNDHWSDKMVADWEETGVTKIKNGRTGQVMPVHDVVYKDAHEQADRLMAVRRVQELTEPALFIHAKGDEAVSYRDAETLYSSCSFEQKEILLIEDSGHTFDTSHPFNNSGFPEPFRQVLNQSEQWFQQHLL